MWVLSSSACGAFSPAPPVSEPSAATARSAATAVAEPPERFRRYAIKSRGLRTGWNAEFSLMNRWQTHRSWSYREPLRRRFHARDRGAIGRWNVFAETLRSGGGTHAARRHHSLMPTGTPPSGGRGLPSAAMRSMRSGSLESAFFAKREVSADLPILFLDARVVRLGERERSGLALLHGGASGVDGQVCRNHGGLTSVVSGQWPANQLCVANTGH